MPITIFDSDTIPRDRRAELEAAVVAAGRHLTKLFRGWIGATPAPRKVAVRIPSYPELDISIPLEGNATAAEVTEPSASGNGRLTRRAEIKANSLQTAKGFRAVRDPSGRKLIASL